ncbi:MAG TPA: hypothetical protein VGF13_09240 [Verrucomicrobiae bacterium]|jgi:hypothetical protein
MKCLLLTFALCSSLLVPSARAAALPYFDTLRAEVLSQLDLATNGVAVPDKKLVSTLQKTLTAIDKTKPDYASGSKSLSKIAGGLNRTSVSNEFVSVFQSTVANYVGSLAGEEDTLTARLASVFPSKSKTAAQSALIQLLNALDGANTNDDVAVAAKFLSTAAKNLSTATKLTVKAENAPPPPSHFTATITGSGEGTVNFSSSPAPAVASRTGNFVNITGTQIQVNGTTVKTRVLNVGIPDIVDGTTTYPVGANDGNHATVVYTTSTGGIGGPPSGDAFGGTSGSLTVNINIATKTAIGTFTFSGSGGNNPGNIATSSDGSFSVVWQ